VRFRVVPALIAVGALLTGCLANPTTPAPTELPSESSSDAAAAEVTAPTDATPSPAGPPAPRLQAGNPAGTAPIPPEAQPEDTSRPDHVIGDGTPASCTSDAVVEAVAQGGVITFNCGPDPVTITMTRTAKIYNAAGPRIVIDGGGLVTLSGGGKHRILYMNTCDRELGWTTPHCDNQDHPQLTVQNIAFVDGNASGAGVGNDRVPGGGGAIFVRGGRFKVVNAVFLRNRCDSTGPDVGGAALRVLDQFEDRPVYVVNSTFGGAPGQGGQCSNGGALSSIGVSWVVLNSVFSDNSAIGYGANPAREGTPGGGSGGAIYADGNRFTIHIAGSLIEHNDAAEGGGAIFFVSNNRTGTLSIEDSVLRNNRSGRFETRGYPGIFFLGAQPPTVSGSTLSP